ncbi:MAG: HIT domain-containing protein [Candidatus Zixiibacteriota bacterium]|nr:MAG: HIT domain-containing protein [candidate division Zixibacteria bacterium]
MPHKTIWAPWRANFILAEKEKGCIFCKRLKMKDSIRNLILYRGELAFVILNKFPYNSGHSLIVPNRHVGRIEKLTQAESIEFFDLTRRTVAVIKKVLKPSSLNLGMNLGRVSGAGIPGHVHMHVVPRWHGDTNFMPVIGETNVVSVPLEPVYRALKKEFGRL